LAFELIDFSSSLVQKQAVNDILKCNEFTLNYGLILTQEEAVALVEVRNHSLRASGRIEFGGGIITKIIDVFYDSPYISKHNYTEVIQELVETFYFYKNETLDLMDDDDLIAFMKRSFDDSCKGSLDLLSGRELAKMAHNLRYGYKANYSGAPVNEQEEEENEYE